MKRKTLVFVYHSMDVGGAEKELLAYVSHLDLKRYNLHLALTRMGGELLPSIPHYVQRHLVSGDSHKPNGTYLINLYRTLSAIKPDAVIGFMQDVCFNILLLRLLTPLRFKAIISEQVVLSEWQKVKQTPIIKRYLIKRLYQKADACFVQSESILFDLKNKFSVNPKRLYLIPSYVNPKEFNPTVKKPTMGVSIKKSYFLYVGRLAPEKNVGLLLGAFHDLHKVRRDIYLFLVGPKLTTTYDYICNELNLKRAVRFVGYAAKPRNYYQQAIALVIPSPVEGRSRVMIEAMIAGCPVITTNFKGHELYIKHMNTGLVFSKTSHVQLTRLLFYALKHPQTMSRIAKRAKLYIRDNYIGTHVRNYAATINAVMKSVFQNTTDKRLP